MIIIKDEPRIVTETMRNLQLGDTFKVLNGETKNVYMKCNINNQDQICAINLCDGSMRYFHEDYIVELLNAELHVSNVLEEDSENQ